MRDYENAMKSTSPRRQGNPKGTKRKLTFLCRKQHGLGKEDFGKSRKGKLHKKQSESLVDVFSQQIGVLMGMKWRKTLKSLPVSFLISKV